MPRRWPAFSQWAAHEPERAKAEIMAALIRCDGHIKRAAHELDIERRTIQRWVKKLKMRRWVTELKEKVRRERLRGPEWGQEFRSRIGSFGARGGLDT